MPSADWEKAQVALSSRSGPVVGPVALRTTSVPRLNLKTMVRGSPTGSASVPVAVNAPDARTVMAAAAGSASTL